MGSFLKNYDHMYKEVKEAHKTIATDGIVESINFETTPASAINICFTAFPACRHNLFKIFYLALLLPKKGPKWTLKISSDI